MTSRRDGEIPSASAFRVDSFDGGRMHRKGPGRFFGKGKAPPKGKKGDKGKGGVHRTNFRLASLPVVVLFGLIRYLAYQLWLVLSLVCRAGVQALPSRATRESCQPSEREAEAATMAHGNTYTRTSVGPGEPAVAKQKHHHRKAFEYISKALKIDEEDKGTIIY